MKSRTSSICIASFWWLTHQMLWYRHTMFLSLTIFFLFTSSSCHTNSLIWVTRFNRRTLVYWFTSSAWKTYTSILTTLFDTTAIYVRSKEQGIVNSTRWIYFKWQGLIRIFKNVKNIPPSILQEIAATHIPFLHLSFPPLQSLSAVHSGTWILFFWHIFSALQNSSEWRQSTLEIHWILGLHTPYCL